MAQKTNWDSLIEDLDQKKDSLFENISQSKGYNTILENKVLFSMGTAIILILRFILMRWRRCKMVSIRIAMVVIG